MNELSPTSKKLIPSLDLYKVNTTESECTTKMEIQLPLLEAAMTRLEVLAERIEKQVAGLTTQQQSHSLSQPPEPSEDVNAAPSYSEYQKLRQPGADSVPGSPREFFNCVFCGVNVSPRGGAKVVKKTDLIREYQRELEIQHELRSSGDAAKLTVETSCADCCSKIKGFCNSPRRLSFNRERSGSPIVSPRGPPSPMLTLVPPGVGSKPIDVRDGGITRSPARVNSLDSRIPRRSSERGGFPVERSGEIKKFTPPRLMQSKSFHMGSPNQ